MRGKSERSLRTPVRRINETLFMIDGCLPQWQLRKASCRTHVQATVLRGEQFQEHPFFLLGCASPPFREEESADAPPPELPSLSPFGEGADAPSSPPSPIPVVRLGSARRSVTFLFEIKNKRFKGGRKHWWIKFPLTLQAPTNTSHSLSHGCAHRVHTQRGETCETCGLSDPSPTSGLRMADSLFAKD